MNKQLSDDSSPNSVSLDAESVNSLVKTLASLELAVFRRVSGTQFERLAPAPAWVSEVFPSLKDNSSSVFGFYSLSIFLDSFLEEAEEHWTSGAEAVLKSGPWHEFDDQRNEYYLEASAFLHGSEELLVIQALGPDYEKRVQLFQKARNYVLQSNSLNRQVQNNDILFHFFREHLVAPSMEVRKELQALKAIEDLPVEARLHLERALHHSAKQDVLLEKILEIFSTELANLDSFGQRVQHAPDLVSCAKEVVRRRLNDFLQRSIGLSLEASLASRTSPVVADENRLLRVIDNLLGFALRYCSEGSSVILRVIPADESLSLQVELENEKFASLVAENAFDSLLQSNRVRRPQISLYFCYITMRRWGGSLVGDRSKNVGSIKAEFKNAAK